ncbi:MAG TPA: hypothetical protein VFH26_03120 [Gemmatimonadales bacterium]|nr:hypothetical protein [Gemmatimonadales bacterium]
MPPEPPANGEYMIAAYLVTALILVGYWVRLWRRAKKSVSGKR